MRLNPPCAVLLMTLALARTAAADDIADIAGAVAAAGHDVPAVSVLTNACNTDPLCVARFLKDRIGGVAALVPHDPGAPQPRGWQKRPPLHMVINDTDGRLIVVPARYDVGAVTEAVTGAVAGAVENAQKDSAPIRKVVIDLRKIDDDGNLDGMRRLAAAFTGAQARAFQLRHSGGRAVDWTIMKPLRRLGPLALEVWIDADISAAEEAFAALMRKHAGAVVLGETSRARGFVMQSIPVTPGWALVVPSAQVIMPEDDLTNGLIPDGPVPE